MSIKSIVKSTSVYSVFSSLYSEIYIWYDEKRRFLKDAKLRFMQEKPNHGSFNDYKKAFWKHRVTYSEYMYSYEFWKLDELQRDEFVSRSEMQTIYRKFGSPDVRKVFYDKVKFLESFNQFVQRKWMLVKNSCFEDFCQMVNSVDCIAKPIDGTCGEGIFKICSKSVEDMRQLYNRCVNNNILLEECVRACDEIEAFHPSSLNTIRVVTVSNREKCVIFGALLRIGAHGSVIDNTHAGGIFAPINIETGKIDVEAIDAMNKKYRVHPDTNKEIVGFKIPYWEEIKETCRQATRAIPDIYFAGWDICVLKDGRIEIIEGNHAPDFDGGMQAPLKIGVKTKIRQCIIDTMGVDPIDYISVWKINKRKAKECK